MKVELLHATPLHIVSQAIRVCWASQDKSDSTETEHGVVLGDKDKELIDRVSNKFKHESVKNHASLVFKIDGITTKTLLALTRHDVGTEFSVQSTRYTTKKAVQNGTASYTQSKNDKINERLAIINQLITDSVKEGIANDEISLLLPQAWQYNLIATFSLSALQHFLRLRLKGDAHWDIQNLAQELYKAIPTEYLYLFTDCLAED